MGHLCVLVEVVLLRGHVTLSEVEDAPLPGVGTVQQLLNLVFLFRLFGLLYLGQLCVLVGGVVAYYHDHRHGGHTQKDDDGCQLVQLPHRYESDEHHDEYHCEEQGCRREVLQSDEHAGGQRNPQNPFEGLAVGTVLALHGTEYLCHGQHDGTLGNLGGLEGEAEE